MSDPGRDPAALDRRLDAHQRFARHEINDWILEIAAPALGERVLDLGCGTGKQLLAVAERVGPGGRVVGLDVAAGALDAIRERLAASPPAAVVRLAEAAMEDLEEALPSGERYDLVLACFSLYYARDPAATLDRLRQRLADGGRLFVCGPGTDNNRELIALCDAVIPREAQTRRTDHTLAFMDETAPPLLAERFTTVATRRFENPVEFPDVESVLGYWRSYHLYAAAYEAAFREALERHVAREGSFVTVKRVSGALAT